MKIIELDGEQHIVGDTECDVAWCGSQGYPRLCVCGGLIHAAFGDESWDSYWIQRLCDCCGDEYQEAD